MSIATDIEVTWNGTVDSTNKIGLSKPLNQLPVNVFDDADYILGYQNRSLKVSKESDGYPHSTDASANNVNWYLNNNTGYSLNSYNNPDGVYLRTILFAVLPNWYWGNDTNQRSNDSATRIVTKLDLTKNKMYLTSNETVKSNPITTITHSVNESLDGTTANGTFYIDSTPYHIVCANVYRTEQGYCVKFPYFIDPMYGNFNAYYGEGNVPNALYDIDSNYMFSAAPRMFLNKDYVIRINGSGMPNSYYLNEMNDTPLEVTPDENNSNIRIFGTYEIRSPYFWRINMKMSLEYWLYIAAQYGMYFEWNGTPLKPVIESGLLKGYTDNMSTPSDIDNWTDVTGHNVPVTPPSPTPSGDDAEAETFGWGGSEVHGMVRYYLLSQAEMDSLQSYMSNANWRMDYRNCVIGMYVVPNGGMFFDASISTTLKFRIGLNESDGVIPPDEKLDTGISCKRITGVVNNNSAVIEIPRINGNFLDYEPYSKYMVYIPFCGVVPLPDYIAGKEIKVTIYPDVPTCTCTAVVSSEGRKIATATGAFGSQLPLTSDGSGLKAASVINSLGNILMGAGEVALGVGTGMVPLAIAGGAQMISSGLQTDLQLGQAFGYSIGASGDTSFFGAGNRCEYYVAYSKWNNPDCVDTNIYGHTYGFVVNKRGILSDFEGFTVCDNPHVSGFSCTSDEKDEIERLLREGIIIHMHEESC